MQTNKIFYYNYIITIPIFEPLQQTMKQNMKTQILIESNQQTTINPISPRTELLCNISITNTTDKAYDFILTFKHHLHAHAFPISIYTSCLLAIDHFFKYHILQV